MKVLVIPEDPTLDQHILKPVVEHLFKGLQRAARVEVLQDPHLTGVSDALNGDILAHVLHTNPMIDLFLLIVDRDCCEARQSVLDARLKEAATAGKAMFGCLAIEEVEVWALALHHVNGWKQVRQECHPKEVYFEPLAKQNHWLEGVGKGRVQAMKALPGKFKTLRSRCSEINVLQDQIAQWLGDR
jgi:hypothetical protein